MSQSTRILIVDDDEDDFLITSDYIKSIDSAAFKIDWCSTYAKAVDHIRTSEHDIYLVDYRLGVKTGLDLLKEAVRLNCEQPIILLTGKGNQAVDKEAMQVGAVDYLIKSELNTEKLERSIRYSLERSASLKALRANERKYRSIFERSKDAVFITDEALRFKNINSATAELLGYTTEELSLLSLYELITEGKDRVSQSLEQTKEIDDAEIILINKQGEKKICILSATLEIDNTGAPYVQGIIHDITNLKRAEKAALQAEKLAATGRLVRTLAHEVRNPLNNIQMSVEQLITSNKSEDDALFLEIIQRNSKRINDLITELLNSARPTELVFKKAILQAVLDDSISAALDRITLQHINMRVRYPETPCYIQADNSKLKIAFLNIIINAVEAMKDMQGELTIAINPTPGAYVVEIIDNGCGISSENISKLFEPYFTSKRNGMGLGLAATLNILQAHKAHIDVKSKENMGTTFLISFPAIA
ncbi:hybrid sensor histidine kinase/response regulator [Ohtaekwangia koreensis]|uniref:histidine kinase n=1 Tax=Ohtaekwangia koreensis TaxID=688867 RepID=A0A1T5LC04_9BACT|nr:hybrid sensor histidine kinase/response regulator [Ohtaekwangia koreensis]SKC73424.1 PAS domain S-box-containing protein [Ohtaekwangia koreensis]